MNSQIKRSIKKISDLKDFPWKIITIGKHFGSDFKNYYTNQECFVNTKKY